MAQSTTAVIAAEIGKALRPLRPALASPSAFQGLALRLGWRLDAIPAPLQTLAAGLDHLEEAIAPAFSDGDLTPAQTAALLDAVHGVATAIGALSAASFDPALVAQSFATEFPERLIELVVGEYLVRYHPTIAFAAKALGVIRDVYVPRTAARPAYLRRQLAWPDIGQLLADPTVLLTSAYGWGTPAFDGQALISTLSALLASLKLQVSVEQFSEEHAELIEQAGALPQRPIRWCLNAPVFYDAADADVVEAGVRMLPLPATGTHLPGLAVLPYLRGEFSEGFPLDDHLSFTVRAGLDLQGGVAIRIRPHEPIDVVTGFASGTPSYVRGMVSGRIEYADPTLAPWTVLGTASGTRLEAVSVAGVGALRLDGTTPELSLEIELLGGRIVIAPGEGDSFLRRILPAGGLSAAFDLALGLSTTRGLYFRGSGGLAATLPIHAQLGPLSLDAITVRVGVSGSSVPIEAGVALGVRLGPITAVAQGVGVVATAGFPGHGGNLGPLDVGVGFRLPDGVGLAIDGGGFSGGGLIARDAASGRYTGVLALALHDTLALTGLGILETHLPDGSDGFSLFVAITAQFRAIQLGLGFTLNGVGGMIGIHRTARVDVIRAGLRDGTLASLLFPADPIANAAHLIADFERVFPTQQGRFVLGPVMRIGWGTPTLITADLGLIIELPDPVRVALVGVVRCFLPHADAPLLELQASFLGTVDLDRGLLAFDASLFDSRLLAFTLDGDVSARLALTPLPNYLLSVGGFHPAYTPPPMDLPAMRRITINLLGGDNPRLRAQAYLARTSNSFQLGASVELYAAVSKFNIYGFLGFDVLVQVLPTHLAADVTATLAVRIGDDPIMSVGLEFHFEGPRPWHATGSAHFEICWLVSFTVHFEHTWGGSGDDVPPEVDVLPLCARRWRARTAGARRRRTTCTRWRRCARPTPASSIRRGRWWSASGWSRSI